MARRRLDAELVRRGLARSREHAASLIAEGRVQLASGTATKPATQVGDADSVRVSTTEEDRYVSRGAHKLIGALDAFPALSVTGRRCLDAGASTGGFTQVLLERGAERVLAVDVGYGQLSWVIRSDPRVDVLERTNVRTLSASALPYRPSLVVADLSFIPLELVLPALVEASEPESDLLLMVKPQFEVGRERVGDGVVTDPALRRSAVLGVAHAALGLGLAVLGAAASPLPGPRGNVEYFLWLRRSADGRMGLPGHPGLTGTRLDEAVDQAVREGPS